MELKLVYVNVILINVVYVIALLCDVSAEPAKQCEPNDDSGCSCKFTDGSGIVDLRSLGTSDGTPRFKDIQGNDGNSYSFSACNGFTEGQCTNAAMCISEEGYQTKIGDAGRTMFMYSPDSATVTAAYIVRGEMIKVSEVEYICDPNACNPQFTPQGMASAGLYKFQLTHVCSCPGLCNENGPTSCSNSSSSGGAFGVGSIMLIVLLTVVIIYIAGGIAYQKVKNKASGTDLIPNKVMWKGFKDLVVAGTMFTFGKCLPKRLQYESTN